MRRGGGRGGRARGQAGSPHLDKFDSLMSLKIQSQGTVSKFKGEQAYFCDMSFFIVFV